MTKSEAVSSQPLTSPV